MGKYYYLVAGLPDLTLEDSKLQASVSDFIEELRKTLSRTDRKYLELVILKYDNKNLLSYLEDPKSSFVRGTVTHEELETMVNAVKSKKPLPKIKSIPPYFKPFLTTLFDEQEEPNKKQLNVDHLNSLYYEYVMKQGNAFLKEWFEFNLNINNIVVALTCRKFNLEKSKYIVGNNKIAELLRTSNARDFGLGEELEYLPSLQRIIEEPDLIQREKKLDLLKWEWLEEKTFFTVFSIEPILAYLIRLEMIERWIDLDHKTGEKKFRELVMGLKSESMDSLEKFKKETLRK